MFIEIGMAFVLVLVIIFAIKDHKFSSKVKNIERKWQQGR